MGETVEGRFSVGRYVMAVWLFFLIGAVALTFGVAVLLSPGNPNEDDLWRYAAGVASALVGAAARGWCVVQYVGRTRRLEVGPDGLSWVKGGQPRSAAWADVREVYRDDFYQVATPHAKPSEWMRRAHVRVVFRDGTAVTFRQTLDAFDALAEAIQLRAAEAVFPEKAAELAATGEAGFGPVAVRREGVRVKGELRPWGEVNYAASGGWLRVAPARDDFDIADRKEVPLSEVPNYLALLALMAQAGKPPADPLLLYPASWRASMARHL